jgi:hypothetical protein
MHDLIDVIRQEFTEYQTEVVTEDFYLETKSDSVEPKRKQPSYWREAYGIAGIEWTEDENNSNYRRIDDYWLKVWIKLYLYNTGTRTPKTTRFFLSTQLLKKK